jgi:hypothetical protein
VGREHIWFGFGFGNKFIPKNSVNETEEKKPAGNNYSYLAER